MAVQTFFDFGSGCRRWFWCSVFLFLASLTAVVDSAAVLSHRSPLKVAALRRTLGRSGGRRRGADDADDDPTPSMYFVASGDVNATAALVNSVGLGPEAAGMAFSVSLNGGDSSGSESGSGSSAGSGVSYEMACIVDLNSGDCFPAFAASPDTTTSPRLFNGSATWPVPESAPAISFVAVDGLSTPVAIMTRTSFTPLNTTVSQNGTVLLMAGTGGVVGNLDSGERNRVTPVVFPGTGGGDTWWLLQPFARDTELHFRTVTFTDVAGPSGQEVNATVHSCTDRVLTFPSETHFDSLSAMPFNGRGPPLMITDRQFAFMFARKEHSVGSGDDLVVVDVSSRNNASSVSNPCDWRQRSAPLEAACGPSVTLNTASVNALALMTGLAIYGPANNASIFALCMLEWTTLQPLFVLTKPSTTVRSIASVTAAFDESFIMVNGVTQIVGHDNVTRFESFVDVVQLGNNSVMPRGHIRGTIARTLDDSASIPIGVYAAGLNATVVVLNINGTLALLNSEEVGAMLPPLLVLDGVSCTDEPVDTADVIACLATNLIDVTAVSLVTVPPRVEWRDMGDVTHSFPPFVFNATAFGVLQTTGDLWVLSARRSTNEFPTPSPETDPPSFAAGRLTSGQYALMGGAIGVLLTVVVAVAVSMVVRRRRMQGRMAGVVATSSTLMDDVSSPESRGKYGALFA